jgi:endonuclease-3
MKKDAEKIVEKLFLKYPNARCELDFSTPFELLVAVILSAQCTDKRVNIVTQTLFKTHNKPEHFANIDQAELEQKIHACGFYRNKAKNIIACAKCIVEKHSGAVPSTVEELTELAGVGKKTANVVYAVGFGGQAIAVDTHVFRVANRIGIANAPTPEKTEEQLMRALPERLWTKSHHALLFHGRYTCRARKPDCADCPVSEDCDYFQSGKAE